MKYSKDIESYIGNIEYYADEIHKALNKQIEEDGKTAINLDPTNVRYGSLGCVDLAITEIKFNCDIARANLKNAEEQDSNLKYKEEVIES